MIDQLALRRFFRFIATDPVAVVYMLTPQGLIVRANGVVVFNNFALLVDARLGRRRLRKSFGIWVLRQERYFTSTVGVAKYRERAAGGTAAAPPDGGAVFDEPFPIRRAPPFDAGTLLRLEVKSFRA